MKVSKAMKSAAVLKRIRQSVIVDCLNLGISDKKSITKIATKALKGIKPMTVAGIKAAHTKKQTIH